MVTAAVIAWLGLLVHNVADLPDQTLLSPETLWPSLVTSGLLFLYAAGHVRLAGIGLFGWALLNLMGGAVSVLPLPVLPFEPEQTLRHYSFHLLYAATQVPLLTLSYRLVIGHLPAPTRKSATTGPAQPPAGGPSPTWRSMGRSTTPKPTSPGLSPDPLRPSAQVDA